MKERYELMHKDDTAAVFEIDLDAKFIVSLAIQERELMPPRAAKDINNFRSWWEDRAVPKTRHNLRDWLQEHGVKSSTDFLLKNLALSLSDCWWIRPVNSGISWKDVNFFDNDFGILKKDEPSGSERSHYTPDASTGGNLPKFWISKNGKRFLVKGNEGGTYQQSYNEVFASRIHMAQGYSEYTDYRLISLKEKGIGCICQAFTDSHNEFISAWDIIGRDSFTNGEVSRHGFAEILGRMGLDGEDCRNRLDYMALTDFVLANNDRHLNNLGVIRDPDTLKLKGLAPIFDNGNSMGFGSVLDMTVFLNGKTKGFNTTFRNSISTIANKEIVNAEILPDAEKVRAFYAESGMSESNIMKLGTLFQNRVEILKGLQMGKSFFDLTRKWKSRGLAD